MILKDRLEDYDNFIKYLDKHSYSNEEEFMTQCLKMPSEEKYISKIITIIVVAILILFIVGIGIFLLILYYKKQQMLKVRSSVMSKDITMYESQEISDDSDSDNPGESKNDNGLVING